MNEKCVMHYLAAHQDYTKDFQQWRFAAMQDMADDIGCSKDTVKRAIQSLETNGYILKQNRTDGKMQLANNYKITEKIFTEYLGAQRSGVGAQRSGVGAVCAEGGGCVPHEILPKDPSLDPSLINYPVSGETGKIENSKTENLKRIEIGKLERLKSEPENYKAGNLVTDNVKPNILSLEDAKKRLAASQEKAKQERLERRERARNLNAPRKLEAKEPAPEKALSVPEASPVSFQQANTYPTSEQAPRRVTNRQEVSKFQKRTLCDLVESFFSNSGFNKGAIRSAVDYALQNYIPRDFYAVREMLRDHGTLGVVEWNTKSFLMMFQSSLRNNAFNSTTINVVNEFQPPLLCL